MTGGWVAIFRQKANLEANRVEGSPAVVFASLASVLSLSLGSFSLAGLEPGLADSDLLLDFRGPESHENCQTFLNQQFSEILLSLHVFRCAYIKTCQGCCSGSWWSGFCGGRSFSLLLFLVRWSEEDNLKYFDLRKTIWNVLIWGRQFEIFWSEEDNMKHFLRRTIWNILIWRRQFEKFWS